MSASKYKVLVEDRSIRQVWISVEASNRDEAEHKVMNEYFKHGMDGIEWDESHVETEVVLVLESKD